jgi:hypothetical protein
MGALPAADALRSCGPVQLRADPKKPAPSAGHTSKPRLRTRVFTHIEGFKPPSFGAPPTRFATLNHNPLVSIPKGIERLNANQSECVQHEVMSRLRATSTLIR